MHKFKPFLITAGIVLGVMFLLANVAPESIKGRFRI